MNILKSKKIQFFIIFALLLGSLCEFYVNGCQFLFLALPRMYIIMLLIITAMLRLTSPGESITLNDIDQIGQYTNFILLYGINVSFNLSLCLIAYVNVSHFWNEKADFVVLSISLFFSSIVHLFFLKRAFHIHVFIYAQGIIEQILKLSYKIQTVMINCLYIALEAENFYLINFVNSAYDSRHKYIKPEMMKDLFFFIVMVSQFKYFPQKVFIFTNVFLQTLCKIILSLAFIVKIIVLNYLNFEYLEARLNNDFLESMSTRQLGLFIFQLTLSAALIFFYLAIIVNCITYAIQYIRSPINFSQQFSIFYKTQQQNNQTSQLDDFRNNAYILELRRMYNGFESTGLNEKQISKLPVKQYLNETEQLTCNSISDKQNQSTTKSENNINYCAICYTELEQKQAVYSLQCKHDYHTTCLKPWLKTHNSCPSCRTPVFQIPI